MSKQIRIIVGLFVEYMNSLKLDKFYLGIVNVDYFAN